MNKLRNDISDVKDVMRNNINKVLERGEDRPTRKQVEALAESTYGLPQKGEKAQVGNV